MIFVEAAYAFKKRKRIIPLKMEAGYEPDGWLGLLCLTDLYYDFSTEGKFNGSLKKLLTRLPRPAGGDAQ